VTGGEVSWNIYIGAICWSYAWSIVFKKFTSTVVPCCWRLEHGTCLFICTYRGWGTTEDCRWWEQTCDAMQESRPVESLWVTLLLTILICLEEIITRRGPAEGKPQSTGVESLIGQEGYRYFAHGALQLMKGDRTQNSYQIQR
jgi:hypothetical protein